MKRAVILGFGLLLIGCADRVKDNADVAEPAAAPHAAPPAGEEAVNPAPPAADDGPKKVPITKREARLVDKKQALQENPALIEVENKINASDPLTAVAQSYFTLGSRAQVAAMQHSIRIQRELNDRWPTFDEFQQSLKQANVKLSALYPYQMYAYDEETGGLVILEDPAEKERHEAAAR